MSQEFATVKKYFESHHIALSDEWLRSCIEWCKEENPQGTALNELQNQVYEQWLNSDFRQLQLRLLPANISSQKKITLYKSMCLQLMYVVDISKPKLHQLMSIRKPKSYNQHVTETVSSKRVLELVLTDGNQEVSAIECSIIPFLNVDLSPGLKVRLNAPITIRMGQIVLDAKNIQLLGGEVDDILVTNAAENILATRLGLPPNPKPTAMEGCLNPNTNESTANQSVMNSMNIHNQYGVAMERPQSIVAQNQYGMGKAQPAGQVTSNNRPTVQNVIPRVRTPDMFDDDFDYNDLDTIDKMIVEQSQAKSEVHFVDEWDDVMVIDDDEDALEPQEKVRKTSSTRAPQRIIQKAPNKVDLREDEEFEDDWEEILKMAEDESQIKGSNVVQQSNNKPIDQWKHEKLEEDLQEMISMSENESQIKGIGAFQECNKKNNGYRAVENDWEGIVKGRSVRDVFPQASTSNHQFESESYGNDRNASAFQQSIIDQFKSEKDSEKKCEQMKERANTSDLAGNNRIKDISNLKRMKVNKGKFFIRAKFKRVVEKLLISDTGYFITIAVEDSSGELEAQVHTDLIASLCGYDHQAILALKDSVSKDPSVTRTVFKCLNALKKKLMALEGTMQVLVDAKESCPVILKMVQ